MKTKHKHRKKLKTKSATKRRTKFKPNYSDSFKLLLSCLQTESPIWRLQLWHTPIGETKIFLNYHGTDCQYFVGPSNASSMSMMTGQGRTEWDPTNHTFYNLTINSALVLKALRALYVRCFTASNTFTLQMGTENHADKVILLGRIGAGNDPGSGYSTWSWAYPVASDTQLPINQPTLTAWGPGTAAYTVAEPFGGSPDKVTGLYQIPESVWL